MRCVKPSSATVSPVVDEVATASRSGDDLGHRARLRAQNGKGCVPLCTVIQCSSVNSSHHRAGRRSGPSRVLDAAERHLRLVADRLVVDVDDPGLDPLREREARGRGRVVMMPAAEPVRRCRSRARRPRRRCRRSRSRRPARTSRAGEIGVRRHVGEQRRLVARPDRLAAGEHPAPARDRVVDAALHELRAPRRLISGPMIVSCSRGSPALRPSVFSPSRAMNSSAIGRSTMISPRRHADLALVQEGAERGRVDRVVEVGVGQHDQRVLAAELEHDALQLSPGRLGELPAGARSSR